MENFRRGGGDRRTEGRSDYGRRSTERNFSGNRNGRYSTEGYSGNYDRRPRRDDFGSAEEAQAAPKRRPRVIRGKDGEIRSMPAQERPASGYGSGYSARRSYTDDRRGFSDRRGYSDDRRGFSERRGYSDDRRSYSDERRGQEGGYSEDRRGFSGERRSFGGDRRGFGGDRRHSSEGGQRGFSDRRGAKPGRGNASRPGKGFNDSRRPKAPQTPNGINRMLSRKQMQDETRFSDNDTINIPVKEEVRLNKFIANSGICSRREADNYILAGVVTVNGTVVTELGSKVNIYTDDVRFNGERLKGEEKVYIVMNKPKGFVTTASDPHAEKTVMDLLKGCKSRVFPVGRLDKYTTGVLMFTNDGEIAEKLTHPSYDKKKIYQVTLDKDLTQEDFDKIKSGIMLTDGEIAADELEYVDDDDKKKLGIEIHSGKNRIVRRIFESLGYEVRGLDRVYFAGLTKKGLKRGQWRFLTQGEENILKMGAYN